MKLSEKMIAFSASPPPMQVPSPRRLDGLQIARAIAAIAVVIGHAIAHPYPSAPGAVHLLGRFGVTLFFVISGYIMVSTTGQGRFDPLVFMRRRLTRIVPVYYAAMLITAIGLFLVPRAFKSTFFDPLHFVKSMLFFPAYRPDGSIEPFLKLGWTLEYEMFFYVTFAGLFFLRAESRATVMTVLFVTLIVLGQVVKFKSAPLVFFTRIDLLGFVFGVWLRVFTDKRPSAVSLSSARITATLCTSALVVLALVYEYVRDFLWLQCALVTICTFLVWIFASKAGGGLLGKWALRPGIYAGDASYSIYLYHMFGVGLVTVIARYTDPTGQALALSMFLAAAAGLSSGLVAYRWIEIPLSKLVRGPSRHGLPASPTGLSQQKT